MPSLNRKARRKVGHRELNGPHIPPTSYGDGQGRRTAAWNIQLGHRLLYRKVRHSRLNYQAVDKVDSATVPLVAQLYYQKGAIGRHGHFYRGIRGLNAWLARCWRRQIDIVHQGQLL